MAFSVCSIIGVSIPLKSMRNKALIRCNAQAIGASSSSDVAHQITLSGRVNNERRSANYPPTMWEDSYIQSLPTTDFMDDNLGNEIKKLKEEVRHMLGIEKEFVKQLELVDTLQQLGLAYHFENEIKDVLTAIHLRSLDIIDMITVEDDIYSMSLLFRLLREHGLHLSPDVFNSFKEDDGSFKLSLCNDIDGMLNLYEASFLSIEGENQMDEAKNFATKCLRNAVSGFLLEPSMKKKVDHALEIPLHWRVQRLHTRWFIDEYENEQSMNPSLLKLAKLDFNVLQGIYKKELRDLSRWWTDLGLKNSLEFARDKLVENYLWTVGWVFEPKFQRTRDAMTKANCLITSIDDVYDTYGSLDELQLFTYVVDRWDATVIEQLPNYMKICFMALFNTTNDTVYETLKLKGINVLPYLKRAWADLCKAYLKEAKWYNQGYKPTLKEYLDNAWISASGHIALTIAYCTYEDISKGSLELFSFYPHEVYHSTMILRLWNDLATSTSELKRGDVSKAIQCYMHESKVTEAAAHEYIQEVIDSTWKKLNGDCVVKSPLGESFKKAAVNISRMSQAMYQYGDGHGLPGNTKDRVMSMLIEPIKLQNVDFKASL